MNIFNVLARGFQFLWALLVMALTGNMIATYNGGSPAIVNYGMFCAVFAMLTLFFLIPAAIKEDFGSAIPLLPIGLDALNVLFWFCGAVAFAAILHVHSCDNQSYIDHNTITSGSSKLCREGQATTAFLWFGFAAFVVSLVFSGFLSRGSSGVRSSGIRRGPAMSQV